METKEEPMDDFSLTPAEKEISIHSTSFVKEPKEEPLELSLFENEIPPQNFMREKICKEEKMDEDEMASQFNVSSFSLPREHFPIPLVLVEPKEEIIEGENEIEEEGKKDKNIECAVQKPTDSPDTVQVEKGRRLSRKVSRPLNYVDFLVDSDEHEEPSRKKIKSESTKKRERMSSNVVAQKRGSSDKGSSQSESVMKESGISKKSDTEMECPECDYRTRAMYTWMQHLKQKHSTTPTLAGLTLLCECGKETLQKNHVEECELANFTVIRKRDGPIRRLEDEKTTPQCVLCEVYPRTVRGYADHLRVHHKSTLKMNEIYLICSCGFEARSHYIDPNHKVECNSLQFTLHKLSDTIRSKDLSTPQCIQCEKYPTTVRGYAQHLYNSHRSTLATNGIFLLCSCGRKITSLTYDPNHYKNCDARQFTLHTLNED